MLQLVVILLLVGIVLLFAEIFFSGFGVFGGIGIAALIAAAIILIVVFPPWGVYLAVLQLGLLGFGVVLFVKKASKKGIFKKLIMEDSLRADNGPVVNLANYSGKEGVTVTPMRPIGTVDFAGVNVEAYSEAGFIDAGQSVIVTGTQDNKIFVMLRKHGKTDEERPNKN